MNASQRLALASLLFCSATVSLAQSSDYVTTNIYIDNVRQPKNVLDIARDCSNNTACMAMFKAADTYFQIPASRVISVAAALAPKLDGEGTFVVANLPSGYAYCKATMHMVSIVPHDGDRGSTFLGQSRANGFYYETWTPVQGAGGGRSWVEAGIKCYASQRVLWYCRGGGCVDTDDRGQSKDASSRPGAGSAK
jgi:hypothetical protein